MPCTYEKARGEDREAVADLLTAFTSGPTPETGAWLERSGYENARVVRLGERPVGCLLLIPMGQWFGGRRTSNTGIAAVTVAVDARGRGAATTLMHEAMRELYAQGVALSTLYASTFALYRRAGFGIAGLSLSVQVPLRACRGLDGAGRARLLSVSDDLDAMKRVHSEYATRHNGMLDRVDALWERVTNSRQAVMRAYGVDGPDGLTGYAIAGRVPSSTPGARADLYASDLVALDQNSAITLFRTLGGEASTTDQLRFLTGPYSPELGVFPDPVDRVRSAERWMLRVVDVERALTERGYPIGLEAEIHLTIEDHVVPQNSDLFVLEVADGRGRVRRGGRGDLRLPIEGLAPLYTGFQPAHVLCAAGLCEGSDDHLRQASAVFAGPLPFMLHRF